MHLPTIILLLFVGTMLGSMIGYVIAAALLKHESCGYLHVVQVEDKPALFLELNKEDAADIPNWKGYITLKILSKLE